MGEERRDTILDDLINEVIWKHFSPILILSDDKLGMSMFLSQ